MQTAEWLKHNWEWIAPIALWVLTSIANGLMKYPRVEGVLQFFIDLISFTTKKDSDGTFKLPGKRSEPPEGKQARKTPDSPPPAPAIVLFIITGSLLLNAIGCCMFKKNCTGPVKDLIDCSTQVVKERGPQIFPVVADIIAHGHDWQNDLIVLAANLGEYGMDIVSCVVQEILSQHDLMFANQAPTGNETMAEVQTVRERAQFFLVGKKFKP